MKIDYEDPDFKLFVDTLLDKIVVGEIEKYEERHGVVLLRRA